MERLMTTEERIRRAEEIYNRRQLQGGIRVSTSSVNINEGNKISLGKKMVIQIIICFFIYGAFYAVNKNKLFFSDNIINQVKYILNYDVDFIKMYNVFKEYFNNNFNNIVKENNLNNNVINNEENKEENNIENTNIEVNDENIIQNETQGTTESEIKIEENVQEVENNENIQETENNENTPIEELPKSQMELDAEYVKQNVSMIKPIEGMVTSGFGDREPTEIISAFHQGIDIGAVIGTSIHAAMSGTVVASSYAGDYGNHIKIQNGTILTVYAHCSELEVSTGDTIVQGQEIAKVGATGKVTGPHLHFEVRNENRYIDPKLILDF